MLRVPIVELRQFLFDAKFLLVSCGNLNWTSPRQGKPGGDMNKNIGINQVTQEEKRVRLNVNKLQAALCIALSAAVSLGIIGWLLR
jgi:hypothetical protein